MKKLIVIIIAAAAIFLNQSGYAQIKQATISVDGFTCSLCAKGVEGQFKSLDFVKSVKTNLKAANFQLYFKSNKQIDISKIRDAVEDGGFTVGSIILNAAGTISGNDGSYVLNTGNGPEINLNNVKGSFSAGDKVTVSGKLKPGSNSLAVSTIKKN
jgi:copper chaperone CopZ